MDSQSVIQSGRPDRESIDRLDDTILETVLSYLPFREKFVLESVSKRFQKLIHNRITELHLTRVDESQFPRLFSPVSVTDYTTGVANRFNLKALNKSHLESKLKKCPNIEKVFLNCFNELEDLLTIGRLCPRLTTLHIDGIGLTAEDLDQFGQQYGHRLREIHIYVTAYSLTLKYWSKLLQHCHNLTHLWADDGLNLGICEDNYHLPKLEYVVTDLGDINAPNPVTNLGYLPMFRRFCQKYGPNLKSLELESYIPFDEKTIELFFDAIDGHIDVQHLVYYMETDSELGDDVLTRLMSILRGMTKLTKLDLSFANFRVDCDQIIAEFNGFANLTELRLGLETSKMSHVTSGTVKCLADMCSLKHLILFCDRFNERFFDDIHKYLPNITKLIIGCDSGITDQTIVEFSKLKRLRYFLLSYKSNDITLITDSSVCALITGCTQIRDIYFTYEPNITSKTIDALINSANERPKITLNFSVGQFSDNLGALAQLNLGEELADRVSQIPSNLSIELPILG